MKKISYSRDKWLGKGAFGVVYRGTLQSSEGVGRSVDVAVKRIEIATLKSENMVEFEIGIMKSLKHENVLEFLESECDLDFWYLALELCNASLHDYCATKTRLKDKCYWRRMQTPLEMLQQMARGLDHMHSNNVVHRDIKPSNILILVRGEQVVLKISDFGLAKKMSSSGEYDHRDVCGTDIYMAPELLKGSETAAGWQGVDIFALGCVFYCFLTTDESRKGQHPFGPINWKKMARFENERIKDNIKSGNSDLNNLDDDAYKDLVRAMIREKTGTATDCRLSIRQVEQIIANHQISHSGTR